MEQQPARKRPRKLPRGLYQYPDGRAYYTRDRRGGRNRRINLGQDLQEAKRRLREIQYNGVPAAPRMTVAQAAQRWLDTRIATGRANPKSRKLAHDWVRRYLEPAIGHLLLSRVSQEDLRAYRLYLEGRCRTLTTVHHILGDARSMFLWCVDTGLLDRSPFPRRLLPQLQERPPDRLTDVEVAKLLTIPEPYRFIVRLALGTGLRWSELCRAQANHVESSPDGAWLVVSETKSKKVRRVPLRADLLAELRFRIGRLCPYAAGTPGSFTRAVRRHSGLQRFHVHQLRHTFACKWLEAGGSLAALQEILGHASIVTTQKYGRISHDMVQREAVRVFGTDA